MELQKETTDLINRALENWDALKELQRTVGVNIPMYQHWDNPDLLWLYCSNNEEDYEGSQDQLGLSKDGKIDWEYQSHCSCNWYEDTHGAEGEHISTIKTLELLKVDEAQEEEIQLTLTALLKKLDA